MALTSTTEDWLPGTSTRVENVEASTVVVFKEDDTKYSVVFESL